MQINEILNSNIYYIIAYIGIIIGLMQCFCGYKYFRTIISIIGFIGGFSVVFFIAYHNQQDISFVILMGLVCGIIGVVLINLVYKLAFFIVGTVVGGFIGYIIYSYLEINSLKPYILPLIFGLLLGIMAVKYSKLIIVLVTAFSGAEIITQSFYILSVDKAYIWQQKNIIYYIKQHLTITIIIAILGIIYQYKDNFMKQNKSSVKESEKSSENIINENEVTIKDVTQF